MSDEKAEISVYGEQVIVAEMPFVALVDRREMVGRLPNGPLRRPPKLFVVCYSPEQDATTMRAVEWEVAATLAPVAFSRFNRRLEEARHGGPQEAPPKRDAA